VEKLTVHIIHDNRRPERFQSFTDELERQGILEFTVWSPVEDIKSVVRSINLSHKQIVRWAAEQGLDRVCIMEDDIMFPSKDGWNFFLKNCPKEFKLYSACNYFNRENPAKELVGLHCYIIHESYYNEFLSIDKDKHIDTAISGIDIHVCYPYPALQREGFSFNNMADVNYNVACLKPEDIYY
jgi:hypothetical protein